MTDSSAPSLASSSEGPKIYEAKLGSVISGAVIKGAELDLSRAIARRQAELDVVVCGNDLKACRALAQTIEAAVGPYERQKPHLRSAGPLALPHFQQTHLPPDAHSFYEPPHPQPSNQP